MFHPSYRTEKNREKIINALQSTGEALDAEAAARVAADTAKGLEQLTAWKRNQEPKGLPLPAVIEALSEVANMTAEEEARLNAIILAELAGG